MNHDTFVLVWAVLILMFYCRVWVVFKADRRALDAVHQQNKDWLDKASKEDVFDDAKVNALVGRYDRIGFRWTFIFDLTKWRMRDFYPWIEAGVAGENTWKKTLT